MNFEYSEKEEKFRTEVRDWLKETLPEYLSEKVRKYQRLTKEDYELENDSEIFTSGSGGIFRSGIPIGKTIATEEIGLDTIKVKFHSDFSQLRLVKIVSFEEVKQND